MSKKSVIKNIVKIVFVSAAVLAISPVTAFAGNNVIISGGVELKSVGPGAKNGSENIAEGTDENTKNSANTANASVSSSDTASENSSDTASENIYASGSDTEQAASESKDDDVYDVYFDVQDPHVHCQLMGTDVLYTDGFTTDMGMTSANSDGIESFKLRIEYSVGDIYYRTYTNEHGWSPWAYNDDDTEHFCDGAKVRAIQVRTKGHFHNKYDFYYRVKLNNGAVLGWTKDGETAGSLGNDKYIQGLQIKMVKKGEDIGGSKKKSDERALIAPGIEGIVKSRDGVKYESFDKSPFTGWAYDGENNKYYFQNNEPLKGWQYLDGYKYYFDENGVLVTDLEPIIGITNDYKIKVNKEKNTLTVYTKDGNNGYILPVKVMLVTTGLNSPVGTFKTYEKYRWKHMHDNIYCQFLLRFKNGFLLHSIIYYDEPDSYHLGAGSYNNLGKNRSDGCVRMLSGDASWVFYNCGVGTDVTIYEDKTSFGPFDRPSIEEAIPKDQTYDPTDPVIIEAKTKEEAERKAKAEADQQAAKEAAQEEAQQEELAAQGTE